jgi:hypothetical protein
VSACSCPGYDGKGCRCSECHGRGWHHEVVPGTEDFYIPDFVEVYCRVGCEFVDAARRRDGDTT